MKDAFALTLAMYSMKFLYESYQETDPIHACLNGGIALTTLWLSYEIKTQTQKS